MEFEFILDKEYEIDLEALSGEFKIIGDDKNIIQESIVYIDDWLIGIIEGFSKIDKTKDNERINIDLITEPDLLGFKKVGDSLQMFYKNESLLINSYDEAKSKLKKMILLLFDEFSQIPNWRQDPNLEPILNFIKLKVV